jgi:hypothetical protein
MIVGVLVGYRAKEVKVNSAMNGMEQFKIPMTSFYDFI